ncbi:MAG: hypothetical protein AAF725_11895 [Acidobacteriota bacterium]
MKKLICSSLLAVALGLAAFLSAPDAAASFTASIDCDFVRSGRGVCEAFPQGPGFSYSWAAYGAGVANRDAPFTSASCGNGFGTIIVHVSHSSGTSSSASTSVSCP